MHVNARLGLAVSLSLAFGCAACGKTSPASEDKPAVTSTAASAVSLAAPPSKDVPKLTAKNVKATFLIDAPLEKIKGVSDEGEGSIALVPNDLAKTTGFLKVKLSTLRTETFDDKSKNESQTEHAHAWMELSKDSSAATRRANEYAVFTLEAVKATPNVLGEINVENGDRKTSLTAIGKIEIHGVTVRREIVLVATFKGPKDAPTEVSFKTEAPFSISLKEHDIKPRDALGKFLDGALEKVGKKIDDKVQISLEARFAP